MTINGWHKPSSNGRLVIGVTTLRNLAWRFALAGGFEKENNLFFFDRTAAGCRVTATVEITPHSSCVFLKANTYRSFSPRRTLQHDVFLGKNKGPAWYYSIYTI